MGLYLFEYVKVPCGALFQDCFTDFLVYLGKRCLDLPHIAKLITHQTAVSTSLGEVVV